MDLQLLFLADNQVQLLGSTPNSNMNTTINTNTNEYEIGHGHGHGHGYGHEHGRILCVYEFSLPYGIIALFLFFTRPVTITACWC